MLLTHLKSAIRSARRHPGYTAINVAGLAVGISACLLISLYVRHELSYDDFHEDAERIYRVTSDWGNRTLATTTWPTAREIKRLNPSMTVAPFFEHEAVVHRGSKRGNEDQVFVAQASFFELFSFPVRRGSAKAAFDRPYSAVITPEKARRYFGDANPIGKTLKVTGLLARNREVTVTVRGVLEPIPEASHFHPQMIVSWKTLGAAYDIGKSFGGSGFRTYVKLPTGASPEQLAAEFTRQVNSRGSEDWNGATLHLQPMTDIHLHSNLDLELEPNGSAATVYLFAVVALFVLVLACVNFVNLATARAIERAREVGVRKTIGANRGQLVRQFLVEAFVLSGVAIVLATVLSWGAMPLFRTLTGTELQLNLLADPFVAAALVGLAIVVTVGAGGYPAFVLSRFDPAEVLGRERMGARGGRTSPLRKGLVIFQFATAVVLLAGTIVVYWQLDYLQTADLGFDEEQVMTVPMPPAAQSADRSQAFRRTARKLPAVRAVSAGSEGLPSSFTVNTEFAFADRGVPTERYRTQNVVTVGTDFFETLGVDVVAGRTFTPGRSTDSSAVVLNRKAFQALATHLPEGERTAQDAIGRSLHMQGGWLVDRPTVIGVVENFHFSTFHDHIDPVVFFLQPILIDTYYVRVDATEPAQVLADLESVWHRVFPDAPFSYEFADQSFDAAYRAEQRMGTLFGIFAGLAVFIACLGLFGLAALMARQRKREIGIRKAVGASAAQIVGLLSKDFALLVVGGIVLAVPVAYIALDQWLDTFAYRIDLGATAFLMAGIGALLVAVLTVSVQAWRAARIDPAQTLRSE